MPIANPMEFCRDVVQMARNREPGASLQKIAVDFRSHTISLSTCSKKAHIGERMKPSITCAGTLELREANKRICLLGQAARVLMGALPYVSQGSILGKGSTRS